MAAVNVYEILDDFEKQKTTEEKKAVLRKYDSFALRMTLRAAMHPQIKFVFEEIPAYKQSYAPPGLGYGTLHQVFDKIYIFEEGNPKAPAGLTLQRRKEILVQLMENLENREAQVFEAILMKKLKIKGLTPKLVEEVFPGLLA